MSFAVYSGTVRGLALVVAVTLVVSLALLFTRPWAPSSQDPPDVPVAPAEHAPAQPTGAIRLQQPATRPVSDPGNPPAPPRVEPAPAMTSAEAAPAGATRSGNRWLFDNGWWAPTADASRQDFAEYGVQMWNKLRQEALADLLTVVPETNPEKHRALRRQLAWAEVGLALAREDRWIYFGDLQAAPQKKVTEDVNYLRLVHEGKMLMGEVKRSEFPDAFNFDLPQRRR